MTKEREERIQNMNKVHEANLLREKQFKENNTEWPKSTHYIYLKQDIIDAK
jgi:hypothetical protein